MLRTIVATALFACYGGGHGTPDKGDSPCSAEEVLEVIASSIESVDVDRVSAINAHLRDFQPSPDENELARAAEVAFNAELLKENADAIRSVAEKHNSLKMKAVKPGTIEENVHVEGTETFVDRMRDSEIVFSRSGQLVVISVASLVRRGSCWRLEHFGTGKAGGIIPPSEQSQRRVPANAKQMGPKTGFRTFSTSDFCEGLTIYRSPSEAEKIGSLVEGFRKYRDPASGKVFEAVLVQSLATGHVKGIWLSHPQLMKTFVKRDDDANRICGWSVRDEEVLPLPEEQAVQ